MIIADLHMHSTASDGTLTPDAVVERAAALGCGCMALTDHDTVAGLSEATAAAEACGIRLIPGIEMSCGGDREIHVLGYGFAPDHPAILEYCRHKREERFLRAERMVERLAENGMPIGLERVLRLAKGAPGRPHVARALIEAGHATSVKEAITRFLIPGKCAYVPKSEVSVAQAVRVLAQAGGIAVLAHPAQLSIGKEALESVVCEWASQGLRGIEVYHPSADAGDLPRFLGIARRLDLLVTGGSDFHGCEVKPDIEIGQGLSRWQGAQDDLRALLAACRLPESM